MSARHTFGKTLSRLFRTVDNALEMADTGFEAGNLAMKGVKHSAFQFERNRFASCSSEVMGAWAEYVLTCEALGEEPALTREEFLGDYSK